MPFGNYGAVYGIRKPYTRQIDVYAYAGHQRLIGPHGRWKTLGVGFTGGEIDAVQVYNVPNSRFGGQNVVTQHSPGEKGPFFHTTDLDGGTFKNGFVATVTFKAGINVNDIHIDLKSFNTYLVQLEDRTHSCEATSAKPCQAMPALYWTGTPGWGFVMMTTAHEVYAFAQEDAVTQASIGFSHGGVDSWTKTVPDGALWNVAGGDTGFGFWSTTGDPVPTGVKLGTVTAPAGACVGPCIDPYQSVSNMEDLSSPPMLYDLVYIYDAPVPTFVDPCSTCGAVEGDIGNTAPVCTVSSTPDNDGSNYCVSAANPNMRCYDSNPCKTGCDGLGTNSPSVPMMVSSGALTMEAVLGLCNPAGDKCIAGAFGDCWSGSELCRPSSCYRFE
jgi:hypothetical protein